MPDHQWLDRLVRGRAWIPVLGLLLAGIVAMQVEVLKLGASIGRSLQRTTALQSRNEQLREQVASLADDQRIERLAAGMGMLMPAPDGVGFLSAGAGGNVQQAISNIHAPNPTSFLSQLPGNGAVTLSSSSQTGAAAGAVTPTSVSQVAAATSTGAVTPTSTSQLGGATSAGPTTSSAIGNTGPSTPGATSSLRSSASVPAAGSAGSTTGTASGGAAAAAP